MASGDIRRRNKEIGSKVRLARFAHHFSLIGDNHVQTT
jgi:hypothetical protein